MEGTGEVKDWYGGGWGVYLVGNTLGWVSGGGFP